MAQMDRRQVLRLAGALGVAGVASACGTNDGGDAVQPWYDSTAKIGLLVPGTGGYKAIGDDIINGFQRYLGGAGNRLGGHPVDLVVEDEGDSPKTAQVGLERLLDQSVHALVGVASSEVMLSIKSTVEEAHVPLLGTNASPRALQGVTYIWRTSYVNNEPGLALGTYLASRVGRPVALLAQDDPTGTDAVAGFREGFAVAGRSARLLDPVFTPTISEPDRRFFSDALQRVAFAEPAAVFACYVGAAAVEFIRQYRDAGLDADRLYGPADLTEGAVLQQLGEEAAGIRTAANYAEELRTAANRTFAVDYRAEYGSAPTAYAVAAYDAAAALDKALDLAGENLSTTRVNLMLSRVGLIDSPRGLWQFNQSRTPTQAWYLREVMPDGPVFANVLIKDLGTLG